VTRYDKRDPDPRLDDLRNRLYDVVSPGIEMFDSNSWQRALDRQNKAADMSDSLMSGIPGNIDANQAMLDEYLNVLRSGTVPQPLADNMTASVNRGLQSGMGSMLNSSASRGVLNSSVTNQGIGNLSRAAANAFQDNYSNIWNSVLSGYQGGMNAGNQNVSARIGAVNAANDQGRNAWEQAAAPVTLPFNFWKEAQASYDRREDYDTVVEQGK
jgi:hypothetical protein